MSQTQTDYLAEARRLWAGGDPKAAIAHATAEYDRIGPGNAEAAGVLDEFIREGLVKTGGGTSMPATADGKLDMDAMSGEQVDSMFFIEGIDDNEEFAL